MFDEGRGYVPPSPVRVSLEQQEIRYLIDIAKQRASVRYAWRRDKWGGGLLKPKVIHPFGEIQRAVIPILSGLIGEYAVVKLLNKRLGGNVASADFELRDGGDGGIDVDVLGKQIQVKTRTKHRREYLVRRVQRNNRTKTSRILPLNSHFFVFCEWVDESPLHCNISGWVDRGFLWECQLNKSPVKSASHFNVVVPDNRLECVRTLVDTLRVIREQAWL